MPFCRVSKIKFRVFNGDDPHATAQHRRAVELVLSRRVGAGVELAPRSSWRRGRAGAGVELAPGSSRRVFPPAGPWRQCRAERNTFEREGATDEQALPCQLLPLDESTPLRLDTGRRLDSWRGRPAGSPRGRDRRAIRFHQTPGPWQQESTHAGGGRTFLGHCRQIVEPLAVNSMRRGQIWRNVGKNRQNLGAVVRPGGAMRPRDRK